VGESILDLCPHDPNGEGIKLSYLTV